MLFDVPDIYFLPEYGKLYESHEKGKVKTFTINDECGKIIYNFIKRPIEIKLDGKPYYDIITPYGYGGPIIIDCKKGKRKDLVKKFEEAFNSYCENNNIVSEFIRFHPMEKNYEDFCDVYDVKFLRKTVATNLQDYGDPIMGEFTSQCRKTVRRSKRKGIKVSFDFDGRTIDEFYKIYVSTMDRNKASDFYYFDIDYFYNLFKNLKGHVFIANALLDEKMVGASVILHYGKYIHAHLTGTYPKYLRYSPNNVIKAEVARWGHKNSKKFYHYGGGVGNSENDGLYRYKKSFSKNTRFKFYIGKRIWDKDTYKMLVNAVFKGDVPENIDFFPLYRAKI